MSDPFTVLGVADDADNAEIRRRYLALVRAFPPDRAPERFQELRSAYEALGDERKRLETKLLHTNAAVAAALSRLGMGYLRAGAGRAPDAPPSRAARQTVMALLEEGIARAMPAPDPSHADGEQHGGR